MKAILPKFNVVRNMHVAPKLFQQSALCLSIKLEIAPIAPRSTPPFSRKFRLESPHTTPHAYKKSVVVSQGASSQAFDPQQSPPPSVTMTTSPPNNRCIYLDYNATTPIWTEVAEEMQPYFKHFGNPSSATHHYGQTTKAAIDLARQRLASLLSVQPHEVHFCGCGTEADHMAIWGAAMAARRNNPHNQKLPHVVTSAIEHPAVLEHLKQLEELRLLEYTTVGVDHQGLVDPADVAKAIRPGRTVLVSIMHSNNEVGSVQPIAEIAAIAHESSALMHTDAAQSVGKVPIDVASLGVDMLTAVGHKFGAPKGVAALIIREDAKPRVERLFCGGGQEFGRRAGTENVLLVVGMGMAAEIARKELPERQHAMSRLRNRLKERLEAALPRDAVRINGPTDPARRLPNTLSVSIKDVASGSLLSQLGEKLAASAGAACHNTCGEGSVSSVLLAMGIPVEWARGTLRLSVGRQTTEEEIDAAVKLIANACSSIT